MHDRTDTESPPVHERLINAAMDCFLADEYHRVTTRQIAAAADANSR